MRIDFKKGKYFKEWQVVGLERAKIPPGVAISLWISPCHDFLEGSLIFKDSLGKSHLPAYDIAPILRYIFERFQKINPRLSSGIVAASLNMEMKQPMSYYRPLLIKGQYERLGYRKGHFTANIYDDSTSQHLLAAEFF